MTILFAGDSFSMYHTPNTWVDILCKNLKTGHWNHSLGGSSIWHAYTKILSRKNEIVNGNFEYIVLTCTSPQRIPFCQDESASHYVGNPAPNQKYFTEEFNLDIWHFSYFERFYSRDLHKFLYKKILEDLIKEFSSYTKLVLLPCFAESYTIVKEVYEVNPNFLYLNFPLMYVYENGCDETNHFTVATNNILGNLLSNAIIKQNIGALNFNEKDILEAKK